MIVVLFGMGAEADEGAAPGEAAGAQVELTVAVGGQPVPPAVGAAAYRIVQESLTNAVRHSATPPPGSG